MVTFTRVTFLHTLVVSREELQKKKRRDIFVRIKQTKRAKYQNLMIQMKGH